MHKYLRNKQFKQKVWKRAKRETPYWGYSPRLYCMFRKGNEIPLEEGYQQYLKDHNDWLNEKARYMDKGVSRGTTSPPKSFLQTLNRIHRAKNKDAMRHDDYDNLRPDKKDAAWLWW